MGDHRIPRAAQKSLKRGGAEGIHIFPFIGIPVGIVVVGVLDEFRVAFNAKHIPRKVFRHIRRIFARGEARPHRQSNIAVNNVHHIFRVRDKRLRDLSVLGVGVGQGGDILLVHPHPLKKIKRIFRLAVEIQQRVIELGPQGRIHPDTVDVHGADLPEPAVIVVVADGQLPGKDTGFARPDVDPFRNAFSHCPFL